ncbi:MAG: S9 family peptidase [Bacteroidetes bacterium]|nr:S9 family peptidase [Bacteroidota bacterium]
MLWKLGRVSALGISADKNFIVYDVGTPDMDNNKINHKTYKIPISGGAAVMIDNAASLLPNTKISPDGQYKLESKPVQILKVTGADIFPDLPKSNVYVYTSLDYRHWDTWEDGQFDHVFLESTNSESANGSIDLMKDEPYDCPQKPFGGDEDYIWNPDGKHVVYVTKKKFGTDYTISTNTDLYQYNIVNGHTINLTKDNNGYDIAPAYNAKGWLAWLSMKRDGYESDKQDLKIMHDDKVINLTANRDDLHVLSFMWGNDGKTIYFIAPVNGTLQLFSVSWSLEAETKFTINQITKGDFDITAITGQVGNKLIVSRTDMNHATEIFSVALNDGTMQQLSHVNDQAYKNIALCKTERRFVTTTDNKKMLVWVIYPPSFDPAKKYPTLLYCEGGPQSPLTQFYSFRWNFQLMASQGYIIVAPSRRGMPGFGTAWNEEISKDWGGQAMKDYLSAIDDVSKETYVDKNRLGCVGASYGGFSVFELAGMHNKRFKTFIAHDGVFDFRSMYGTTDEMWFENWEKGGAYWEKNNAVAQKSFSQSPSNFVDKWDTPIMIVQGGKDYRVPIEQGQQAFQAAQLRGIKSKFLFLPEENHWVLKPQNALVWQREFYSWLKETL